jgi:hypothetical protein
MVLTGDGGDIDKGSRVECGQSEKLGGGHLQNCKDVGGLWGCEELHSVYYNGRT